MPRLKLEITGMTCDGCAHHVRQALEGVGARDVSVDWRAGRAELEPRPASPGRPSEALAGAGYRISAVREAGARNGAGADGGFDYDLAIVGSGGAAFAAAIQARRLDKRVVMIERGAVGGTCVNVGCIPESRPAAPIEALRHSGLTSTAIAVGAP